MSNSVFISSSAFLCVASVCQCAAVIVLAQSVEKQIDGGGGRGAKIFSQSSPLSFYFSVDPDRLQWAR